MTKQQKTKKVEQRKRCLQCAYKVNGFSNTTDTIPHPVCMAMPKRIYSDKAPIPRDYHYAIRTGGCGMFIQRSAERNCIDCIHCYDVRYNTPNGLRVALYCRKTDNEMGFKPIDPSSFCNEFSKRQEPNTLDQMLVTKIAQGIKPLEDEFKTLPVINNVN